MYEYFLHHESGMPPWIESSKLNNEFLEEDDCERNARRSERERERERERGYGDLLSRC
jgi:hypothetical protein